MLKISKETILQQENMHPGISHQIEYYEHMELPVCPKCNTKDTASVNVGVTARTIFLATATSKFHLQANDKQGKYYCNVCKEYFG